MSNTGIKRVHERAVRTSISLPPVLFTYVEDKCRLEGFSSFSDYIQHLIREQRLKPEAEAQQQEAA